MVDMRSDCEEAESQLQRLVKYLFVVEEATKKEIADHLGVKPSSIATYIARAREEFGQQIVVYDSRSNLYRIGDVESTELGTTNSGEMETKELGITDKAVFQIKLSVECRNSKKKHLLDVQVKQVNHND